MRKHKKQKTKSDKKVVDPAERMIRDRKYLRANSLNVMSGRSPAAPLLKKRDSE